MRNASGSMRTASASSSISISVAKHPCGWPGARIARCWPGVGEDVRVLPPPVREVVDVRQREARRRRRRRRCPTSPRRTRVSMPSARDAGLDLRERRRAVAGREVLFLAIEHQLDRRARLSSPACAQMMPCASGPNLLPKPPPMYSRDHADVGLRNLERLGEALARAVHGLRRHPRGQLVALPLADAAVRLEADVRLHLRLVAGLDDVRGRLEAGVEIAALLGLAFLDVAVLEDRRRARAASPAPRWRCAAALRTPP